jgi:hypothetical protein
VSLLETTANLNSPNSDYYWCEYVGETPDDAIIAGKDINNRNVHIGQAYVHDAGLIVTQIFPGVKEVYVTYKGVRKIDKYVKVSSRRFVKLEKSVFARYCAANKRISTGCKRTTRIFIWS